MKSSLFKGLQQFNLLSLRSKMNLALFFGLLIFVWLGFIGVNGITQSKSLAEVATLEAANLKLNLIRNALSSLGFGGAIHHFKNNIIRDEQLSEYLFLEQKQKASEAIRQLKTSHLLTAKEEQSADLLLEMLNKYHEKLDIVKNMKSQGKSLLQIDQKVRIDDTQYVKAAIHLNNSVFLAIQGSVTIISKKFPEFTTHYAKVSSQHNSLKGIHQAMGYGGLIHHFKNFLLRGEEHSYENFITTQKLFNQNVQNYKTAGETTKLEDQALKEITQTVNQYRKNLDIIKEMHLNHSSVKVIDEQVKIDDSSSILELNKINRFLEEQAIKEISSVKEIITEAANRNYTLIWVIIPLTITIYLFFGGLFNYSIFKGFEEAEKVIIQVEKGDVSTTIRTSRKDEIGRLINSLEVMRNELHQGLTLQESSVQNERKKAEESAILQQKEHKLVTSFESQINEVTQLITGAANSIDVIADELSYEADQMSQQTSSAMKMSIEASKHVSQTVNSSKEIAIATFEVQKQTDNANKVASDAVKKSADASSTVSEFVNSAEKVNSIVQMITSIADKTNLLALNASIEAARAGEAGRGFAVVAQEVKELANQTATATSEVANLIGQIQSQSNIASHSIDEIGKVIIKTSELSESVSNSMHQQSVTANEISDDAESVATQMSGIDKEITDVSRATVNVSDKASKLLKASTELNETITKQQMYINSFITQLDEIRPGSQTISSAAASLGEDDDLWD